MTWKERASRLAADIPALYLALKSGETPMPAKAMAALTVAYALSPIDLIPDFIPVLGAVDDLAILPLLAAFTIWLIPPEVFAHCREQAKGMWGGGTPRRWYFALPAAAAWLGLLTLVLFDL